MWSEAKKKNVHNYRKFWTTDFFMNAKTCTRFSSPFMHKSVLFPFHEWLPMSKNVCVLVWDCECQRHDRDHWWVTYRENEAVLEVGKLFITLLTAVHAILLVNHFFVAVLAWAGLIKAILLAQIYYGSYAGVVVCLERESKAKFKV